ncbi:MAG: peptide ABC transporter substrate-binding protein [Vulcanimicrobiaceae bacterium]
MIRPVFALIATTLLTVLFVGCSKSGSQPAQNDQLTLAVPINPTQLNPILEQNAIENAIDGLMFDELVTIDNHGKDVPDLAAVVPTRRNGGISSNGLVITYHLRKDARWSDGKPVTSADVKFTWQAIMNPRNNVVSRHGYDAVASIDTPDPYTVVLHMKRVFPPAIDTIFGESDSPYRILPAHLLRRYSNLNDIPFNADPVTSGPYRFVRWLRGDKILLDANRGYFRGAPTINHITIRIIADDNTTEAELRTHEVDLAFEITGTTYNDLRDDPNVVRQLANSPDYTAIFFNVQRPPLNDELVRHAIAMAIDRSALVRDDTYGTGTLAIADISPFSWAYDPHLAPIPFDAAAARALLDRAGWRVGPNGIREKDGRRLSLQLVYGQGSELAQNVTVQVQQMLRSVGIDVQLKSYDYQILYAAAQDGGILNGGKFDMTLYAWVSGSDPDNSSDWLCSEIPPAGNNVTRYCSKAMDRDQTLALSTFNRTKRKADYAKIERLLLRDVPGVFLYYQPLRYARIANLRHFSPNGISEGWNASSWRR